MNAREEIKRNGERGWKTKMGDPVENHIYRHTSVAKDTYERTKSL